MQASRTSAEASAKAAFLGISSSGSASANSEFAFANSEFAFANLEFAFANSEFTFANSEFASANSDCEFGFAKVQPRFANQDTHIYDETRPLQIKTHTFATNFENGFGGFKTWNHIFTTIPKKICPNLGARSQREKPRAIQILLCQPFVHPKARIYSELLSAAY